MSLEDEANQFRRDLERADQTVVRVAVFGQPGGGKSSLINEILGIEVAQVGVRTDTTVNMECHTAASVPGVQFCDLPGYGTERFPASTYFRDFGIETFDVYICVSSGKLVKADSEFFRYLVTQGRPCILVSNKHDELWQRGKSIQELEQEKIADIRTQVDQAVDVIFTSCRPDESGQTKGIEDVKQRVFSLLGEAKRDRWARSMQAKTDEALKAKKEASRKRVTKAAAFAVLNGALNPIPGVDFAVDLKIFGQMKDQIRRDYGLTQADVSLIEGQNSEAMDLVGKLVNLAQQPRGSDAVKARLEKYVSRKVFDHPMLPVLGKIISGGIAWRACVIEGNAFIDACHRVASNKLQARLRR